MLNLSLKEMEAREFAMLRHGDQKYGDFPYIYHLDKVNQIATTYNLPMIVRIGSFLHDILEDTPTSYEEILELFGKEVAEIVLLVTDKPGKTRVERKKKTYPFIKTNVWATALKLCDRIANVTQCLQHDPSNLYGRYYQEYEFFRKELYSQEYSKELEVLWEELDRLLLWSKSDTHPRPTDFLKNPLIIKRNNK